MKAKKEKELADDARLLRAWKKFHREEREAVLAGPYGATLAELFRMFANMKHVAPALLVGFKSVSSDQGDPVSPEWGAHRGVARPE
ncbi:MAG TPA: hypothetical protein VJS43_00350 [Candidatus Acidoferrales bacterium]|nr:hypothetical protein [Candidatus Acidoferrales bacterium]